MQKVAKFHKVSLQQFERDWVEAFGAGQPVRDIYSGIPLPRRATFGSAGYDFVLPGDLKLGPGETVRIPTGIRAQMRAGWVLLCFPRSGLGFKYRLQLDNTVGVIDEDYFNAENEGHIQIQLTNDSKEGKTLVLEAGQGFAQGIFLPFGLAEGDEAGGQRTGGFGSTDNKGDI
ncbi:deoxyuridine 5'-triphosphate nucleotidohydrolase [Aminipila butyrica]|uniref:dUTP diphosphatase n=1 Tax=Aminipila butyrica TaxID=433296 RepID=A0A858BV74_9FIRM|nr:deoxyuridine 5'-triphosphate nucleotidohydrolase [Aminipila butyrica]QIB69497.1 deoxyuridine 5'-triphosphate nucleotidohydrolase [Aminipila butyrica]